MVPEPVMLSLSRMQPDSKCLFRLQQHFHFLGDCGKSTQPDFSKLPGGELLI